MGYLAWVLQGQMSPIFLILSLLLSVDVQGKSELPEVPPCLATAVHEEELAASQAYARNFDAVREAVMNRSSNGQRSMDSAFQKELFERVYISCILLVLN